jgi:hypothetical protein
MDLVAGGQQLTVTSNTADVDQVSATAIAGGTAVSVRLSEDMALAAGHFHVCVEVDMVVTPAQTMHGTIRMKGLGKGLPVAPPAGPPPAGPYGRGAGRGGGGGRGAGGGRGGGFGPVAVARPRGGR